MAIEMGQHSYGSPRFLGEGLVKVGKYTSIAPMVQAVFQQCHRVDWVTTYPFPAMELATYASPGWPEAKHIKGHPISRNTIEIGNDVWIGYEATILGGAKIGDGAVVGMFALVAGNVPPYSIVVGSPAERKKYRFGPLTIECLLAMKWWDWPRERVVENLELLCSNNIYQFIEKNWEAGFPPLEQIKEETG